MDSPNQGEWAKPRSARQAEPEVKSTGSILGDKTSEWLTAFTMVVIALGVAAIFLAFVAKLCIAIMD